MSKMKLAGVRVMVWTVLMLIIGIWAKVHVAEIGRIDPLSVEGMTGISLSLLFLLCIAHLCVGALGRDIKYLALAGKRNSDKIRRERRAHRRLARIHRAMFLPRA